MGISKAAAPSFDFGSQHDWAAIAGRRHPGHRVGVVAGQCRGRDQDQHGGTSPLLLPDGTLAKGVCHHFIRTGTCKYGDSCRYFHPKPDGANPALAAPGAGPGATMQQSNIFGSQSNFVGYQGAERNPFSEWASCCYNQMHERN